MKFILKLILGSMASFVGYVVGWIVGATIAGNIANTMQIGALVGYEAGGFLVGMIAAVLGSSVAVWKGDTENGPYLPVLAGAAVGGVTACVLTLAFPSEMLVSFVVALVLPALGSAWGSWLHEADNRKWKKSVWPIVIAAALLASALFAHYYERQPPRIFEKNDAVQWYSSPRPLSLEEAFAPDNLNYSAWEVGTYQDPQGISSILAGSKVVVLALRDKRDDGDAGCDRVYRVLLNTDTNSIYYLPRYSPLDFVSREGLGSGLVKDPFSFEQTDLAFIPSLEYPGFLYVHGKAYEKKVEQIPCNVIYAGPGGQPYLFSGGELSEDKLFSSTYGDFYLDTSTGDIVTKGPDGIYVKYQGI